MLRDTSTKGSWGSNQQPFGDKAVALPPELSTVLLANSRGVTRSRAMRSREIKLDDITRRVKNRSCEICELSKLLFLPCGGSNAPLLRLDCQNLKKEKKN